MEQETSNEAYQEAKPTLIYNASGGRVSQNAATRTEDQRDSFQAVKFDAQKSKLKELCSKASKKAQIKESVSQHRKNNALHRGSHRKNSVGIGQPLESVQNITNSQERIIGGVRSSASQMDVSAVAVRSAALASRTSGQIKLPQTVSAESNGEQMNSHQKQEGPIESSSFEMVRSKKESSGKLIQKNLSHGAEAHSCVASMKSKAQNLTALVTSSEHADISQALSGPAGSLNIDNKENMQAAQQAQTKHQDVHFSNHRRSQLSQHKSYQVAEINAPGLVVPGNRRSQKDLAKNVISSGLGQYQNLVAGKKTTLQQVVAPLKHTASSLGRYAPTINRQQTDGGLPILPDSQRVFGTDLSSIFRSGSQDNQTSHPGAVKLHQISNQNTSTTGQTTSTAAPQVAVKQSIFKQPHLPLNIKVKQNRSSSNGAPGSSGDNTSVSSSNVVNIRKISANLQRQPLKAKEFKPVEQPMILKTSNVPSTTDNLPAVATEQSTFDQSISSTNTTAGHLRTLHELRSANELITYQQNGGLRPLQQVQLPQCPTVGVVQKQNSSFEMVNNTTNVYNNNKRLNLAIDLGNSVNGYQPSAKEVGFSHRVNGAADEQQQHQQPAVEHKRKNRSQETYNRVSEIIGMTAENNHNLSFNMNKKEKKARKRTSPNVPKGLIVSPKQQNKATDVQQRLLEFKQFIAVEIAQDSYFDQVIACPADRHVVYNPQYCAEYAEHIFSQARRTVQQNVASANYLERNQSALPHSFRAILIDWLVNLHKTLRMQPETLFLTVNLIDRFLEAMDVQRRELQLVGITAMFIASKYEEIYPPRIQDFVTSAKGAFSKEEIFEMEFCMLSTLDFNVHFTSSYDFLGRYAFLAKATTPERNFAQYLLEASFIEYPMLKYSLANLAASALYFALRIMRQETSETRQKNWGVQLAKFSGFSEGQLRPCCHDLIQLLKAMPRSQYRAVFKKFSKSRYNAVATIDLIDDEASTATVHKTNQKTNDSFSGDNTVNKSTCSTGNKQQFQNSAASQQLSSGQKASPDFQQVTQSTAAASKYPFTKNGQCTSANTQQQLQAPQQFYCSIAKSKQHYVHQGQQPSVSQFDYNQKVEAPPAMSSRHLVMPAIHQAGPISLAPPSAAAQAQQVTSNCSTVMPQLANNNNSTGNQ